LFDTHGSHDDNQADAMRKLLAGVNYLWTRLEEEGIADRTTVMISSNFGRTPYYNSGKGKDHWNVTSAVLMGVGIRGGREPRNVSALQQRYHPDARACAQGAA
jgi:uncharacterized protein (DUF1501 family)